VAPASLAHPHVACSSGGYERHCPEDTVLYRTVAAHWPAFRERAEEAGGLPDFVVDEFEAYLRCGRLEHGCLHLACRQCGHSLLVAFSCKKRGFCPSCCGRRMVDTAVHLVERVLPPVPIRHWIGSLPWGLRALLGYDRQLCADVMSAFVGEITRSLQHRAKRLLGLRSVTAARGGSVTGPHTGAVLAIQRTDSALRLNVHAHVLALDGVYVRGPTGALVFHALPTPSPAEVFDVARRTADRIDKLCVAHGRDPQMHEEAPPTQLELDHPGLAACYTAAARGITVTGDRAGQPALRLICADVQADPDPGAAERPVAEVRGVNVHAVQLVDGRDRRQLERLCKYITRPPVASERLRARADGKLELVLKSVWRDGTRAILLEPHDLIARLVAAIPPPSFHMLRYFGVLSSHAKLRRELVPEPAEHTAQHHPPSAPGDQLMLLFGKGEADTEEPARHRWAWLLRHVFSHDLDTCPRCGGPMRWLEAATTPDAIARLLAQHDLAPRAPPTPPAPPAGQLTLALGS
jgi:hypothetical protein